MIEVVVGRIGKPHGLRGEVTVELRTDEPERRFVEGAALIAVSPRGQRSWLTVERTRWHQGVLLVHFEGVGDRTAAEGARGTMLIAEVDPGETPEDPEEFYDHQLVGLRVVDTEGVDRGEVTGILHGAQDLLEIRTPNGPVLVPFVTALVPTVDVTGGRVVVADRPGLLDPSELEA
jgi:16S rRNA processing protein RimM